ncbi:hypothetical protein T484DRAFT_1774995, partial [Baffinella frigidus]
RVRGEKITPLMAATREGRGDVMRILLEGVQKSTPLMVAMREGHGDVMRMLLEGVQVKHAQVRSSVDLRNSTYLKP